jgi:hypothetical protein
MSVHYPGKFSVRKFEKVRIGREISIRDGARDLMPSEALPTEIHRIFAFSGGK